jgi:hypothetical protein
MLQRISRLFSQNGLLQDFSCDDFDLKYPKKWKADSSENHYSFYYNTNVGELRISVYESTNLSEKELKQTLKEIKENQENNPDIKSINGNGTLNLEYKFIEADFVTYLKIIQNEQKMYFLSLYWEEDSWNDFKDLLLESFYSIRAK